MVAALLQRCPALVSSAICLIGNTPAIATTRRRRLLSTATSQKTMPHADSALVPAGLDKAQFWAHVHAQLAALLDGQRAWVRPAAACAARRR